MHIAAYAVVRPSVSLVCHVRALYRNEYKHILKLFFTLWYIGPPYFFHAKRYRNIRTGYRTQVGYGKSRFSTNISFYHGTDTTQDRRQ